MDKYWQQFETYVESRELRERVMLFVILLLVLAGFFYSLLLKPLMAQQTSTEAAIAKLSNQIVIDQAQTVGMQKQLATGVFAAQEEQLEKLNMQLATVDAQLKDRVGSLIEPELMADVLEEILLQTEGMQLLSLRNQAVESLIVPSEEEQDVKAELPGLYRHGVTMRLSGSYMAAIKYLESLEALPWQLYWNNLDYRVEEYPNAIISLDVHTVSLSEDWIGV